MVVDTLAKSMQPAGLVAGFQILLDFLLPESTSGQGLLLATVVRLVVPGQALAFLNLGVLRPASPVFEIFAKSSMPSKRCRGCAGRVDLRGGGNSSSSFCGLAFFRGMLLKC